MIILWSKGLSRVFLSNSFKASILGCSAFFMVQVSHPWRDHSLNYADLCQKSNVFAFQHAIKVCHSSPAKKQSSSNFMVSVNISSDFRAQEEDICHCFQLFSCYLTWSDGTGCHDLSFLFVCFTFQYWVLRQFFFSPSSRGSLVLLCFLPIKWYHSHIWISWYFSWQSWFQLVTHPAWHFSWCALCLS